MTDLSTERLTALTLAARVHQVGFLVSGADPTRVTGTAEVFWGFLTGPVTLTVTAGPGVDQTTGKPTGNPGGTSMVAIKDSEKFEISLSALDAKGQITTPPTDATLTSSDDTILTVTAADANGQRWGVGGNPGSVVVTAEWPDSPSGDLKGTLAVDVTAGAATSLLVSAGTPVPQ